MDKDEYHEAYIGRVGSDRMGLKLSIIPDKIRGDMDEVAKLCVELDAEKAKVKYLQEQITEALKYLKKN